MIASNVPPTAIGPAEYDPDLGDVVVLGGTTSPNPRTVTWVWDGSTWMTDGRDLTEPLDTAMCHLLEPQPSA